MTRHVKAAMKSVEASDLHSLIFTNVGIYPVLEDVLWIQSSLPVLLVR